MEQIRSIPTSDLNLDWKNPRLAEFNLSRNTSLNEIYELLWDEMALDEIVISITAHGFFETEPLLVVVEDDKYIVIEGNRRLASVKIILEPALVGDKLPKNISDKITGELQNILQTLPVLVLPSRQEAWRFIGFKHINGAAKWNSFAKAIYIANVHHDYDITLGEIAYQVGDTHNTVQKLYQGLMVIEQAESWKVFDRADIMKRRLYFSHLYTALQYDGFRKYLGINQDDVEKKEPILYNKKEEVGEVLTWLYGSRRKGVEPVIKTQNPDLRYLDKVLINTEAVYALRSGYSLEQAYELSLPSSSVFQENILSAKRYLQKAWANVTTGYDGDYEMLKSSSSLANLADKLYNTMDEIYNRKTGKIKKSPRVTEE